MTLRHLAAALLVLAVPAFWAVTVVNSPREIRDVRAAIINGGGATDFCARFLDGEYRPVKDIMVTLADR